MLNDEIAKSPELMFTYFPATNQVCRIKKTFGTVGFKKKLRALFPLVSADNNQTS